MTLNKFGVFIYSCLIFFCNSALALDCIKDSFAQSNMTICANEELDEETKKLNSAYKNYIKFLDEKDYKTDTKKLFKESQLAWIKYKDLYCKFKTSGCENENERGSMCGMEWSNCQSRKTKERLKEIEEVFEYEKRL